MSTCFRLLLFVLVPVLAHPAGPVRGAPPAEGAADEQILRDARIPLEGTELLEFFRSRTVREDDETRIAKLVDQLGDDSFEKREEASRLLVRLGERARPFLQKALSHADVEVVRRAEECIDQISKGLTAQVVAAAVRVLAQRRPEGAARVLLEYLPSAEDSSVEEEICRSLARLAADDPRTVAALTEGMKDRVPARRGAAGAALARARIEPALPAVRRLLADPDPRVRSWVALALAGVPEREAVPALIALLDEPGLDSSELGRVEDLLYRLAEEDAPRVLPGNDPASRKKYREAWLSWWKDHQDLDLARLAKATQTLGYTLVVLLDENKVVDLDAANRPRWQVGDLMFPLDVQLLAGDRILVAEHNGARVTERNTEGKVLWEKKIDSPLAAQRLANGNTFIATRQSVVEVDPTGKEVFSYTRPGGEVIMRAQKLRNGDIALITQLGVARYVRLDATGKELASFGVDVRTSGGRVDVTPAGHVLIPENGNNRVVEYDPQGKVVWEAAIEAPIIATRQPNGQTLVTSMNPQLGAVLLDRGGKQVWQYRADTRVTRAYRR